MHHGVRSANVVSHDAQFSAAFKEQQAICGMFDHVAFQSVRGRAGFGTFRNSKLMGAEDIALESSREPRTRFTVKWPILIK
jgi:hypothetical protein